MVNTTELHVCIDDLQPGTEYEFAVRVHIDAWSDWSMSAFNKTKADETTTSMTPLSAPIDVRTLVSPFSILVMWSDPSLGLDQAITGELLSTLFTKRNTTFLPLLRIVTRNKFITSH